MGIKSPLLNDNYAIYEKIATIDSEAFMNFSNDIFEAQKKGFVRILFAGPRLGVSVERRHRKILMKKYELDNETFELIATGLLACIHNVLAEEVDHLVEKLEKEKGKKVSNYFQEITEVVKKLIKKYPAIEQDFQTYTYCRADYFDSFDWDVSLKHVDSHFQDIPLFAYARIKIGSRKFAFRHGDDKQNSIDFVISRNDLDYVIKSFQDIKEALTVAQAKVEELKEK